MVVTTDIHKSAWSIVAEFTCGSYQTRLGAAPAVAGGVACPILALVKMLSLRRIVRWMYRCSKCCR